MDKVLFILCLLVIAATPAGAAGLGAGGGIDPAPRGPGLRHPEDDKGRVRIPLGKQREDNASTGAGAPERRRGTDLGYEAEKEEEAFLKKQRTAPLKRK